MQILASSQKAIAQGNVNYAVELILRGEDAIREMVDKQPSRTDVMFAVASVLHIADKLSDAEQWYEKILEQVEDASVYKNLGDIYSKTGRVSKSEQSYKRSMDLAPDRSEFMSAYLFNLHYLAGLERQFIFDEHRRWAHIHAPMRLAKTDHSNNPDPDRRLRVGYISPDFCTHSVAYFFEPLLDCHDRESVEVYGYSNVASPDHFTERLKVKFDHFRDIARENTEQVVKLIEDDGIDILVDLAGHTGGGSPGVLARKPAPVQLTFCGYPDTTGMQQIDYRLTDALAEGPEAQKYYTEKLVNIPDGFCCYRPSDDAPAVGPLPYEKNGYITYGSFNSGPKVNPDMIELWSSILSADGNSRLLLKFHGGDDQITRDNYLVQLQRQGVDPSRIEIYGRKTLSEHFQLYNRIDIALDTFPYNGTTTTCEALWMGVPVVSLVGEHHVSRVGLSILTRVGMGFFACKTAQEYVSKAKALASKPDALKMIRSNMRSRMAASGICYSKAFARNVESAYREMWHKWCGFGKAKRDALV